MLQREIRRGWRQRVRFGHVSGIHAHSCSWSGTSSVVLVRKRMRSSAFTVGNASMFVALSVVGVDRVSPKAVFWYVGSVVVCVVQ